VHVLDLFSLTPPDLSVFPYEDSGTADPDHQLSISLMHTLFSVSEALQGKLKQQCVQTPSQ